MFFHRFEAKITPNCSSTVPQNHQIEFQIWAKQLPNSGNVNTKFL